MVSVMLPIAYFKRMFNCSCLHKQSKSWIDPWIWGRWSVPKRRSLVTNTHRVTSPNGEDLACSPQLSFVHLSVWLVLSVGIWDCKCNATVCNRESLTRETSVSENRVSRAYRFMKTCIYYRNIASVSDVVPFGWSHAVVIILWNIP